eukprot:TRINITY_DN93625_c0_g1_i1.p1 TRINITY_DN93625_c0_g1~~TRINITY_DN93625_c0_g1_i1.p1  ORF type:complete len:100 (-),score=4.01 TRINITY_DN93625_c0_g1_i1:105-404(-)
MFLNTKEYEGASAKPGEQTVPCYIVSGNITVHYELWFRWLRVRTDDPTHNRRILTLARSAFHLLEVRNTSVARFNRRALEPRPDLDKVELFSPKEQEEL